jgi:hypothetical protein
LVELKESRKECDALKTLNIKLVEQCQNLQGIIDEEASAHTIYHDYPPKADSSVSDKGESSTTKE